MPELPFVTVVAENLAPLVVGRTVEDVIVRGVSVLKTVEPPIAGLRGRLVVAVRRRGKLLMLEVAAGGASLARAAGSGAAGRRPRGGRRSCVRQGGPAPDGDNLTAVIHLRRNGRLRTVPRGSGRTARDLALALVFDAGPDLHMIEMGPKKAASVWEQFGDWARRALTETNPEIITIARRHFRWEHVLRT